MIVDSSAVVAILRTEPEGPQFAEAMRDTAIRRISAANYLEAAIVIDSAREPISSRKVNELMETADIIIEAVTETQAKIAREAYRDFGKGSGHPAGLNFGDCFAYALAKVTGEPLLFKGADFSETDIVSALAA